MFTINQNLIRKAHAVVRLNDVEVNAQDLSKITINVKHAITILNEEGKEYASLRIPKDDFRRIGKIKGYILNSEGDIIDRIRKSDLNTINAAAGQSGSIDDTEILAYKASGYSIPFTFVYEYKLTLASSFLLPDWQPVSRYHQAVENERYKVTVPQRYPLKIKAYNSEVPEPERSDNGTLTYTWELNDFTAQTPIPFSPPLKERVPYAHIKTDLFELEGLQGKQSTWQQFGEWIVTLNQNRDILKQETRNHIRSLVEDCKTDQEKIEKIYSFMQSKSRYVSVKLGVGGWQTIPASEVDETGYGDCKGLSNYTYALLKEAGIKANYTLIRAGSNARSIEPDFPKNQFNHVILMVPLQQDTVWLECTSQRMPCGYLGNFTDDRHALVIEKNSSHLVKTPNYTAENNFEQHTAHYIISQNGQAKVDINSVFKAYEYDGFRSFLYAGKKKQERYLYNRLDFNDFTLNNYSYEQRREKIPSLFLTMDLTINNYASTMGTRLFVPINQHNQTTYVPKKMEERKEEIWITRPYTEVDSSVFDLPEEYSIESIPESIELVEEFGEYRMHIEVENKAVKVTREMIVRKGTYPASQYEKLHTFYKKVKQADRGQVVLVKSLATN